MVTVVRCFALLVAAATRLWAREPTSQDYDVWLAVLAAHAGTGTIQVWHLVEPTTSFDRGETKNAVAYFPEVLPVAKAWSVPAAELDHDKFRFAQQRSPRRFGRAVTISLLDASTLRRAAGRPLKSTWLISPKLIPESRAICRLSWPAYREDGRAAFLICAICIEWWGAIIKYQVNKDPVDGGWKVGLNLRADYTDWKSGELVNDDSG